MEEPLDEGFPEVLLHTLGLQHQSVMKLTELLDEAVGTWASLVVLVTKVFWQAWVMGGGYRTYCLVAALDKIDKVSPDTNTHNIPYRLKIVNAVYNSKRRWRVSTV